MKAAALEWLLEPSNPAVRYLTLVDVLGRSGSDAEVRQARSGIHSFSPVRKLEGAQKGKGSWPPFDTCYEPKFTSTVWQLMLLGETGLPRTPWVETAIERFLKQHQMQDGAYCCPALGDFPEVEEEPCLTGNMVRTLIAFGYGDDPRVKRALDWLPESQFKDGGWNCDHPGFQFENGALNWGRARHSPAHSSFMSTIEPLWAYSEVPRQKWTRRLKDSAERGAEFLLSHRLYKSHIDSRPVRLRGLGGIYPSDAVTRFHFPMYYYYDALHALRVLTKMGYDDDERIQDALDLVKSKMWPNGRWTLEGDWVRERKSKPRKSIVTLDTIGKPSKWVTLNCYRVLVRTGDLDLPT